MERTPIPNSYVSKQNAPIDGYTIFKTKEEALALLTYDEETIYDRQGNPVTKITTDRFIGQTMLILGPDDGEDAEPGEYPCKYWFKGGIQNQYLVPYDLYPWEYIEP